MNANAKPRILCVDDERNVLDSFRRLLRKDFDLNIASSGTDGLSLMEQNGPFAVVVSDFKMPGIDGVEFLTRARKIDPDCVRIMLTGQAEETTAAKAINDGHIFRFLNKPISSSEFLKCLKDGIRHHNLIRAEKDVLEKTLKGSIDMMSDILSLTNPLAFSRATRVQKIAQQIAESIGVEEQWQLEVAAILAHLGYVTIPPAIIEKHMHGERLSPQENQMFQDLPEVTQKLIGHIPRLETILTIIKSAYDNQSFETLSLTDGVKTSGAILRTAIRLDTLLEKGYGKNEALNQMAGDAWKYNHTVLDQIKKINVGFVDSSTKRMSINQLRIGMILNEDIRTPDGLTVAPKGFVVNDLIRQLLKNLKLQDSIPEFVEVIIEDSED